MHVRDDNLKFSQWYDRILHLAKNKNLRLAAEPLALELIATLSWLYTLSLVLIKNKESILTDDEKPNWFARRHELAHNAILDLFEDYVFQLANNGVQLSVSNIKRTLIKDLLRIYTENTHEKPTDACVAELNRRLLATNNDLSDLDCTSNDIYSAPSLYNHRIYLDNNTFCEGFFDNKIILLHNFTRFIFNLTSQVFHYSASNTKINLDLNSLEQYYSVRKIMLNMIIPSRPVPTIETLALIIANSKKFMFVYDESDAAQQTYLQSLHADLVSYFSALQIRATNGVRQQAVIAMDIKINSIIRAIRTGATARGTSPFVQDNTPMDFWQLGPRLVRKLKQPNAAKKTKYASLVNQNFHQQYCGAGNVALGLEFIRIKVKSSYEDTLYAAVIDRIKTNQSLISDAITTDVLLQIIDSNLTKVANGNILIDALLNLIRGYKELASRSFLIGVADQIIELLILDELSAMTAMLSMTLASETATIRYRSCIDLLCVIIVLRLANNNAVLNDALFPAPAIAAKLGRNVTASSLLIANNGQDALEQSLYACGYQDTFTRGGKNYLPGFLLKTMFHGIVSDTNTHQDVAVYFEIGRKLGEARVADKTDQVACVGRTSEIRFDLTEEDLAELTQDVSNWCATGLSPKMLCLDMTITKTNDELTHWVLSPPIQRLITDHKLELLVWQSEQKQHSLGTGKFSAGSAYLLTADEHRKNQFNIIAAVYNQKAPDNNLATFFRKYCSTIMFDIIQKQIDSAKVVALVLNNINLPFNSLAIANGPFVTIVLPNVTEKSKLFKLIEKIWPRSNSFGFNQTTSSTWDENTIRLSIGLEAKQTLKLNIDKLKDALHHSVTLSRQSQPQ